MRTSELLDHVRRLEIRTRRIVDELAGGAYHSVFKGRGIEFNEVREYVPGDDVRSIDWNVTARFGHPYIKQYVEERELTVMLLVDCSASGEFGGGTRRKTEAAAELAALLAFSAIRNNDQAGLLLFTDQDELHLPPRKGRGHVLRLVRELLAFTPRHRRTNIRRALEHLMASQRRRAVVFLISDFLDEGYEQALRIANRRHDVIAVRILDDHELRLPDIGGIMVEDAETGEAAFFPGGAPQREQYARAVETRLLWQNEQFRRAGVDCIDLRADRRDAAAALMRFFRARERRRYVGV